MASEQSPRDAGMALNKTSLNKTALNKTSLNKTALSRDRAFASGIWYERR